MNAKQQVAVGGLVLLLVVGLSGCRFLNKVKAKDRLNTAAVEYKHGNYERAQELLEEALALDPTLPQLKPYYGATLYARFNLTGDEEFAHKALEVYQQVYEEQMQKDNPDVETLNNTLAYIAAIYGNLGDTEKKHEWMKKRLELPGMTPESKAEIYYSLATDYWNDAFQITQQYVMNKQEVPDEEIPKVRELANKGLEYIEQALALRPEYADALTYKNLLLRELAKVEKDPKVKEQLISQADEIRQRAMELMKRKREEEQMSPSGSS